MTAPLLDTRRFDAVIFDMDGVVTDSAAIHFAAWKELFDEFLTHRTPTPGENLSPFTRADYLAAVDGKPRYDGVRDFLATRGISLPEGDAEAAPDSNTVRALGDRKDRRFLELVARDGVPVFDSTVTLVRHLQAEGIGTAIFSASRNCAEVLHAAGLDELFPVRVDGLVAEELQLPGKPDPAMLIAAARRLGVEPERTVAVEGSEAGVHAGRIGGFGLVIGVDRGEHADRLRAAGADAVVTDLAGVRLHGGFDRMSALPNVLDSWPGLGDLFDTEKVAVLLDFDGTLSEIVPEPGAAALVDGAGAALRELAERCPVAIISGRDLGDLTRRVGVEGIWYAGCHGFELQAPNGVVHRHEVAADAERVLAGAVQTLRDRLADIPGVRLEHKRYTVAVHYRQVAAERVGAVIAATHTLAAETGLRAAPGRKVVELRPDVDWDKGSALRWILDHLTVPVLPVYLGDDLTDEDAFDAVTADGLGIIVRNGEFGDRYTAARYALSGPRRVREFLEGMVTLLAHEVDRPASDTWTFTFDGYDPARERLREALCTVGNGYLATRGAAPESVAGQRHYPATYVAGVYNRLYDEIGGRAVDNESLVNLPNWLPLTFRIGDGDWFDLDAVEIQSYRQEFDLRRAVLSRRIRIRDRDGRVTGVVQRRFASMQSPHLCALETVITPVNWSGTLTVRSTVDAGVRNGGVARYAGLADRHLEPVQVRELSPGSALTVVRTGQSRIAVAVAARTEVHVGAVDGWAAAEFVESEGVAGHDRVIQVSRGDEVTVEKTVVIVTGRDHGVSAPDEDAVRWLSAAGRFTELLAAHTVAWEHLWDRLRLDLEDGAHAVRVLRLHLLHLIQTLSPHSADLDVGVPARGLHGEAYRGHVFWDELFVFPVLNPRFPALTRALLHYRYRRLPEARSVAATAGLRGAAFPWQSGNDGLEESQRMHLNPLSGHWNPDHSWRARHIGSAVAYNVWQYYQVTGDIEFLTEYGAEMLVEIARYWASAAEYDPETDRYHLRGVIGPDEFHAGYPQSAQGGVDDNAYTNVMAAWTILRARDALAGWPRAIGPGCWNPSASPPRSPTCGRRSAAA
nr:trehalose-phosphatase [Nocardia seriolae]